MTVTVGSPYVPKISFADLFDASPDGITIDQKGNLIYANPAMAHLFGFQDPNLYLGRSIESFIAPRDRERVLNFTAHRENGAPAPPTYEFTGLRVDNSEFPVEASVAPLWYKGLPSNMAILRDVTARHRTEAALRDANEQLNTIIFTASHDLRSPVVSLSGFLGLLKEKDGEHLSVAGHRYLQRMDNNLRQLLKLMDGLLDYSRSSWNKELWQWVDVNEVLGIIKDELHHQIEAKGITLNVETELPLIYAEGIGIHQIFSNLISNAIKYMGEQTKPVIRIVHQNMANEHHFLIIDNGIGVAAAYHEHIFQPFHTLQDKRAGKVESCGLGLSIIKRIVERHNGQLWVVSDGATGSTFHFTLAHNEPDEGGEGVV